MSAADCQVKSVPFPVLEMMLGRANNILAKNTFIIQKPEATDGLRIVATKMNRVFTVTKGQGGGLHCDKSCTNKTTRICEHVLAVAEKKGKLEEFLNWFKRGRHSANLESMKIDLAKKQIGKKKSTRKTSNVVKFPVTQMIDILE